jgi:hypothetical protein
MKILVYYNMTHIHIVTQAEVIGAVLRRTDRLKEYVHQVIPYQCQYDTTTIKEG